MNAPAEDDLYDITLCDGKYRIYLPKTGGLQALRYGEPWRDLTGDGLVLALVQEIDRCHKILGIGKHE